MSKYNNVVFHQVTQNDNIHEIKNSKSNINHKQILGTILALSHYIIGGIGSGYASVLNAQANSTETTEKFIISRSDISWIMSIVLVPMAPSCFLAGFLLTKARKKTILILATLIETISWFLMSSASSLTTLLIARGLSGIGSVASSIMPLYLAEISHPNIRGIYLCMVLLGLSTGLLIIHILGAFFTWTTCALINSCILIAYLCLMIYLPESYAWYLKNNRTEEMEASFFWYRVNNEESRAEFAKILEGKKEDMNTDSNPMSVKEFLKICSSRSLLMPVTICLVSMLTLHLSGVKTIMFYSISIVSQVIPSLDKYTSTIIVDVIRIVMTCIGSALISRFPVRPLFIVSGVGSALSHIAFAILFSYMNTNSQSDTSENQLLSVLTLISLISYTMFSSVGIAQLPWVIAGEIFPSRFKGIASGICTGFYFLMFFVVIKLTPELFDAFGISGGFLAFGACTLSGTFIMYLILPETKNKTLKEIEDMFK